MAEPDSPSNWIQLRLFYSDRKTIEESVKVRQEVDRRTINRATELGEMLGPWNIEWAIKEEEHNDRKQKWEFFALRVKPALENHEKVKHTLCLFARKLKDDKLILFHKFDHRTWLQSEKLPDYLNSWDEWHCLVRILHALSLAFSEAISLTGWDRVEYFFHEKIIHHLHNMMHIMDNFRPRILPEKINYYSRFLLLTCPRILFDNGVHSWPKHGYKGDT